jgi:1,4-dihydroxy-2-naphthoate octaprenyltransferase
VGLGPGCFSVALLALNNLRDVEEDRLTQKNTLVVRYGERFGKIEITGALLAPFLITPSPCNIVLIPVLLPILKKLWNDEEIPHLLGKIGGAYIFYTLLYCIDALVLWK